LATSLAGLSSISQKLGLVLRFHGAFIAGEETDETDAWDFIDYVDGYYMPQYIWGYDLQQVTFVDYRQLDCETD
jgi:hypothetical protein